MEHVLTGRAIVKLFRFEDGTVMVEPVVNRFTSSEHWVEAYEDVYGELANEANYTNRILRMPPGTWARVLVRCSLHYHRSYDHWHGVYEWDQGFMLEILRTMRKGRIKEPYKGRK